MITQEQLDAWKAALRSGEWKQCRGEWNDGNGGHCCLDVLLEINNTERKFSESDLVEQFIGMISINDAIDQNDDKQKTFPEIADWLDTQTPESLAR